MKLKTLLVSAVALLCSAASWAQTDCTSSVATDGWKKTDGTTAAGETGSWAMSHVRVGDNSDVPMYENYNADATTTTGIMLQQTVTGLTNGTYTVELYANSIHANSVPFGDGISAYTDARVYLFANNQTVPVMPEEMNTKATSSSYILRNVQVTSGTLHLGLRKNAGGTNWQTIQIKSLTLVSDPASTYGAIISSATVGTPVDATFLIQNHSFETSTLDGWTNRDGIMYTQDNGGLVSQEGKYYAEIYWWDNTIDLNQTTPTLPAGFYKLTARAQAADGNSILLYAKAGTDAEVTQTVTSNADYNVEVFQATTSIIKFGLKGEHKHFTWVAVDNFRLTSLGNPYPALEEAINEAEGKTLGFEDGEYAPYNNVAALTALSSAKAINETRTASYDEVVAATTALTGAAWTANVGEVNAFCGGDFTQYETINGKDYPYGWNLYHDGDNRSRIMGGTEGASNAGLAATTSHKALLLKFNATYGESEGYTMPLKAGKIYKVTFKHGRWAEANPRITDVVMTDPDGASITLTPGFQAETNDCQNNIENWYTYTGYFVSTKAGNYNFNLNKAAAGPGEYEQMQIAIGDIDLRTASALELSQTGSPAYAAGTYPSVTLPRELSTDNWNTLCLPFATPVSDYAAVRELTDIDVVGDHVSITFTDVAETLVAGKPYLVKGNGGSSISATDVAVLTTPASAPSVTEDAATVIYNGIFAPMATVPQDAGNYVVSSNNLYLVDSEVSLKGYRGYFNVTVPASVKSLALNFDDADVIKALEAAENAKSVIYNLAGQRLSKAQKGVNIINGKKVLVK